MEPKTLPKGCRPMRFGQAWKRVLAGWMVRRAGWAVGAHIIRAGPEKVTLRFDGETDGEHWLPNEEDLWARDWILTQPTTAKAR